MGMACESIPMSKERRKEIVRHLSEDDLDRLLAETDDEMISKWLIFIKNLYQGDTFEVVG